MTLADPIKHGDETITEITLTTPNVGGLMEIDEHDGQMAKAIATASVCSGLPPSVIKQLMPWDMKKLGDALSRVMGESMPRAGRKR